MTFFVAIIAGVAALFALTVVRGAPYVPSHRSQVRRAFGELYPLSNKDCVVDLGSGDGVVLGIIASRGAKAIGYEINPVLWLMTRFRFRHNRYVSVRLRDYRLLETLPSEVTVVYAFSTSHNIDIIDRKLRQWSGARPLVFISYGFQVSGREPDETVGAMYLYRYESGE